MGIALAVAPAPVPRAFVLRLVPRQRMSGLPGQHEVRPAIVPVPVLRPVHVDDVAVSGLVAALREELSDTG